MANTLGTGIFGIPADEDGLVMQSIDFNYTNQSKDVLSREGEIIGKSLYQEKCEITMQAWIPQSGAYSTAIGNALTLTNSIPDFLDGGVSGGTTIVENVTVNWQGEDHQQITINAAYYPFI